MAFRKHDISKRNIQQPEIIDDTQKKISNTITVIKMILSVLIKRFSRI